VSKWLPLMCLSLQVDQLYKQAAAALQLPEDKFKLVQKGTAITNSAAAAAARQDGSSTEVSTNSSSGLFGARQRPSAVVHLSAGGECVQKLLLQCCWQHWPHCLFCMLLMCADGLLVMPQRKLPMSSCTYCVCALHCSTWASLPVFTLFCPCRCAATQVTAQGAHEQLHTSPLRLLYILQHRSHCLSVKVASVLTVSSVCADVLLVMPQRKAPSERLQRAAAEAAGVELCEEDDSALRFSLRPGAAAWEAWLARFLQVRV
jgi:hypothetical protein